MSEPSSLEPRMLERRVSNNRADLSNDQQMNFVLSWFNNWSELQKDDFVCVLGSTMAPKHVNGVTNSLASLSCSDSQRKKPSLFDCQMYLYHGWVHGWSDDQKTYLILRLREKDGKFGDKYDNFLLYGKDSPNKDYFEPGIPAELDLSGSNSVSLNASFDGESVKNLSDDDIPTKISVPVEVDPPVGFDDENPKSDFEEEVISTSDPISNQTEDGDSSEEETEKSLIKNQTLSPIAEDD
ncbi:uncharacterized protein LOC111701560 [Eurytemora carolleeae]|uniref:uncharacterized protein LOC111701560 n=1 Tax=Eurytemora carolleeae TaxID=1294199 RepID=UPI000C7900AE|nr:uncharacterized protein LOC111701560 [Eurytemora carolleeae]|eukprot:XP_023328669.1 uncharacterized protein LOC111701560 [Eurytemora affinis]